MRPLFVILSLCLTAPSSKAAAPNIFPSLPSARIDALSNDATEATVEELYSASLSMGEAKDWERAVFFLWCAQVRLQFERALFPPAEKGGNSPTLPLFAIGQMVGQTFVPKLYTNPGAHRRALVRLRAYVPEFKGSYRPSWNYNPGIGKAEGQAQAKTVVSKIADSSSRILELTAIPEYLQNLIIYVEASDEKAPKPEQFLAANEIMWRIEEEKKIKSGLAFPPRRPNQALEPTRGAVTPRAP